MLTSTHARMQHHDHTACCTHHQSTDGSSLKPLSTSISAGVGEGTSKSTELAAFSAAGASATAAELANTRASRPDATTASVLRDETAWRIGTARLISLVLCRSACIFFRGSLVGVAASNIGRLQQSYCRLRGSGRAVCVAAACWPVELSKEQVGTASAFRVPPAPSQRRHQLT